MCEKRGLGLPSKILLKEFDNRLSWLAFVHILSTEKADVLNGMTSINQKETDLTTVLM